MKTKEDTSRLLFSSQQIRRLENQVCFESGKSLLDLMNAAGAAVAELIKQRFTVRSELIVISCGPGNNGGDGLVIGRVLKASGYDTRVVLVDSSKYSAELQQQIEICKRQGFELDRFEGNSREEIVSTMSRAGLIVDCLLGTGQSGAPRGLIKDLCQIAKDALKSRNDLLCIAVDCPTGMDCDQGQVFEDFIQPDITAVIQYLKSGQLQLPASELLGEVVLVDAGISCKQPRDFCNYEIIISAENLKLLPRRLASDSKADMGHVLVVGGSRAMPGAARLSAMAAIRSGAGLVTQAGAYSAGPGSAPEIMLMESDSEDNLFDQIAAAIQRYNCLLIGPGLGRGEQINKLVMRLLELVSNNSIACVLDADGLNALAELKKSGKNIKLPTVVLTPHAAEAARLLQISSTEVQSGRYKAAERLSEEFSATVVLKGHHSICFDGKSGAVNCSGGSYLATAGSGDVLAGMLAGFLAGRLDQFSAAKLATYLHGKAGEMAFLEHGGPIISSDIIAKIPFALGKHAAHSG